MHKYTWIVILCITTASGTLTAQYLSSKTKHNDILRIYIDGQYFSYDYIRRQVDFVNYVRDRKKANIYLLITRKNTGGNGNEYTLAFTGMKRFTGINDTLRFYTKNSETNENKRKNFVDTFKRGLVAYMNHTPLGKNIEIIYKGNITNAQQLKYDKWDSWVFNLYLRGKINGEKSDQQYHYNASIQADRITKAWKIRLETNLNYDEDDYFYEGENIKTVKLDRNIHGFLAKSVSNHWSMGLYSEISSATYNNLKRKIVFQPAIEYDFFPYSLTEYRELFFQYKLGYSYNWYLDTTIYDKIEQPIIESEVGIKLRIYQYWGNIHTSLVAHEHIMDLSRYRINLDFHVNLNLLEGFALNVGGGYAKIADQISIPKTNLSLEDLLLQRREIATNYSYYVEIGFNYTFGSIYNNTVNPRFEN